MELVLQGVPLRPAFIKSSEAVVIDMEDDDCESPLRIPTPDPKKFEPEPALVAVPTEMKQPFEDDEVQQRVNTHLFTGEGKSHAPYVVPSMVAEYREVKRKRETLSGKYDPETISDNNATSSGVMGFDGPWREYNPEALPPLPPKPALFKASTSTSTPSDRDYIKTAAKLRLLERQKVYHAERKLRTVEWYKKNCVCTWYWLRGCKACYACYEHGGMGFETSGRHLYDCKKKTMLIFGDLWDTVPEC